MCGLTGFFDFSGAMDRLAIHSALQAMTLALHHRGPDSGDVWQDPDCSVGLGHRRLAIVDLSAAGAQPMMSSCGRYVLVYNGEIYNAEALRPSLSAAGAVFEGSSDTEVLLASIALRGIERTLDDIAGMFVFAVWDREDKRLTFARDRLGQKPLYIGWGGGALVFGSELKALRAHPNFKPSLDQGALKHYMRYGCVHAPRTIYDQVWQLKPGHFLSLRADDVAYGADLADLMHPFWELSNIAREGAAHPFNGSAAEALNVFEGLLQQAVQGRMIADVPFGAFLSGGIDSSLVTAVMQGLSAQQVKSYAIGFENQAYDEVPYAREVAAHLGTDHHEYYVSEKEILSIIPQLADMYDEPLADISSIPTYLLSHFARKDVTVALSGDGGDELMGGYTRHRMIPQMWDRFGGWPEWARGALAKGLGAVPDRAWDIVFGQVMAQPARGVAKARHMLEAFSAADMYEHARGYGGALTSDFAEFFASAPEELSLAEQIMVMDGQTYLPDMVLVKVDRASMACALEVRSPLLDHRLFEFVSSLPLDYKIHDLKNGGQGKYLMRQLLDKHVPRALFDRPKQGFNMPVGEWLRGDLRDWAETLLSPQALEDSPLSEIMDVRALRAEWDDHLSRGGDGGFIWTVLMAQAWVSKWL